MNGLDHHNNNNNNNNNKTYKCLINIQPPYVVKKDGEYSGIIYDAWKKVKEHMPDYTFEETFFPNSKNNLEFMNSFNNQLIKFFSNIIFLKNISMKYLQKNVKIYVNLMN